MTTLHVVLRFCDLHAEVNNYLRADRAARYNVRQRTITLADGSRVLMVVLADEGTDDAYKLRGQIWQAVVGCVPGRWREQIALQTRAE